MSNKNSRTTADFLEWSEALSLIQRLERDKRNTIALLFAIGVYIGLRIGDILKLKWIDVLNQDSISIKEKKTGKERTIKLNQNLKEIITRIYSMERPELDQFVFLNKQGTKPVSIQYLNDFLKTIKVKYRLKIKNISTHTLRKTFGRHVWDTYNQSEKALVLLSEIFDHSSIAITKRYLGIKQEELQAIYDLL